MIGNINYFKCLVGSFELVEIGMMRGFVPRSAENEQIFYGR